MLLHGGGMRHCFGDVSRSWRCAQERGGCNGMQGKQRLCHFFPDLEDTWAVKDTTLWGKQTCWSKALSPPHQ
eukprot:1145249-Pelagomonas_calceolata.AAC.3